MSTEIERAAGSRITNSLPPDKLVEAMFKSGYFSDVKSLAQAYVKVLAGEELGLSPFASMTGLTMIEGKLGMTSNLMATLLQESRDYDYRIVDSTNERAEIAFYRGDTELGTSVFTIEDAQRAGLVKQKSAWEKYPKAMLFARALTQGIRLYCPIVTKGSPAYTVEELGVEVNQDGEPISPADLAPIEEVEVEVVEELDEQRVEAIKAAISAIRPDLKAMQLMLGAAGIDSIAGYGELEGRLKSLTIEQYDRLMSQLDRLADGNPIGEEAESE
jgi:hypothetical protein